ncbi:MAG TPA: hypothetical protein VGP31_04490 [Planosporangium sp.]|jgi:hypothetical protein|nr:hypothetical protein [Planosporangium sp.]
MSEPPPSAGYQVPPLGPVPPPNPFADPSDPLISPDYAGWWRRNVALLRAYWRPLLVLQLIAAAVALVLRVPTAIAEALGSRELQTGARLSGTEALHALGNALPWLGVGAVGAMLSGVAFAVAILAGMRLIVVAVTGGQPDVGAALRGALRRLFPLVGWGLLAWLIVLAGICACFLPGLYFVAVFTVLPAVVLFERGGVIARCFKLFHADLGASLARVATIIGIAVAAALITSVVGGIVNVIAGTSAGSTGPLVGATLVTAVLGVVVNVALGVVLTPLILTTYADERARREPVHTGVLAHELATA